MDTINLKFSYDHNHMSRKPRPEGVWFKQNDTWGYNKIDCSNVCFTILASDIKTIDVIIDQFKCLNPGFKLDTIKYYEVSNALG